jgi:Protein of unknown function (DUF1559)
MLVMSIEQAGRPDRTFWIRVRIVHLVYGLAFFWSAKETFGTSGILLAAILCAAWGWVFWSASRPRAFAIALLLLLLSGCLLTLILPATQAAREGAPRMQCANHLKQIAVALVNYHEVYKSFPPAHIADENGRPMHSWRVLILPYLEQQPLYDAYRFDKPWDGPNNSKLLIHMPRAYSCSSRQLNSPAQTHTSYLAVVGKNTAWPGQRAIAFSDIVDGSSSSLLVCETSEPRVSWMEPADIEYADAIEQLTSRDPNRCSGHVSRTFFYEWSHGRNVALADGSIQYLIYGIETDHARRLLNVNDGGPLDFGDIRGTVLDTRRLRIDNCIRLSVFVLLALWPLPWVWINPHGTRRVIREEEVAGEDEP